MPADEYVYFFEDVGGQAVCHSCTVKHTYGNTSPLEKKLEYLIVMPDPQPPQVVTVDHVPYAGAWKHGWCTVAEGEAADPVCTDGGMSSFR